MRAFAAAGLALLLGVIVAGPDGWIRLKARYEDWRLDRDPDALCRIADVLIQAEKYAEAVVACEAALRRRPEHPTAAQLRGEAIFCMSADASVLGAILADVDDVRYARAERLFQAGEYEKASLWCERSLQLNPSHAPAKALLTEVQFLLGQGMATPTNGEYDKYMTGCVVRHQQVDVEIETALARAYRTDDPAQGERECRKVLEYAKWLPDSAELRAQHDRARAYLECVSGFAASAR
ncbi:MAG TPA: hypothetical protein VF950_12090 [Planctomycetota bacterium]